VTSQVDDGHRRLVPRWRYSNRTILGFEHRGDPRDRSTRAPKLVPIQPLNQAWQASKTYVTATDLMCAAVALAQPELARAPSEWLLSGGRQIPAAVRTIAHSILEPDVSVTQRGDAGHKLNLGAQDAQIVIALNRRQLSNYPRSASRWLDLALAHSVLGNRDKAMKCMGVALSIEPNNRVVLRAAVRLLVHLGKAEEAFEFLRRHPRTRTDPWLLSQDVSVANIVGRAPTFLAQARRLLRSDTLPPGQLSELASALGTLATGDEDWKHARKLHRISLIAPSDNVLAQVEWLRQRDRSLPQVTPDQVPGAMEAQFWRDLLDGEWRAALKAVYRWQNDEPYSTRPARAGSFLATSIVQNFEVAEQFADCGLRSDPSDTLLMNNLVVAKARHGDLDKATAVFSKIRPDDRLATFVYRATRGLLKYASGDEAAGAEDYRQAIRLASDSDSILMVRSSWLDTQVRWGTALDPGLLHTVSADAEKPGSPGARGVALCVLNMVRSRKATT
jgi:hypothetical protein